MESKARFSSWLKAASNQTFPTRIPWLRIVEFPDLDLLQKQMEDKVRVQSPQADNEDV